MRYIKIYEEYNNLKEWFGDSKVVDDKGNPNIVYHGSQELFDEFNSKYAMGNNNVGEIYFTESQSHSEDYGDIIYKVYLKIENPYILDAQHKYFDDYYDTLNRDIHYVKNSDEYDGIIVNNLKDPRDGKQSGEEYDSNTIYIVYGSSQIRNV